MKVAILGPCASGTTTLANHLRRLGYDAHAVAQEHSYVPDMWRMTNPDVLVYLDASLETIRRRRQGDWDEEWLAEENRRLAHARAHCHLYLATDHLTVEEVVEKVVKYLGSVQRREPALSR